MIIKRISTDTFAGLHDKAIEFKDGVNVIFGENESGKTTLINALYRALTGPDSKNSRDKKLRADFYEECFPTNSGNFIDAKVDFSENEQLYRVSREWDDKGKSCNTRITLPDNSRLSGKAAEEKLSEILEHPAAIYSNLVFGRDNHKAEILDWCSAFFNADMEKNDGIEKAREVSMGALSAASGVSTDKLEQTLDAKIEELSKRWDMAANRPEGNRDYKNSTGIIYKCHIALKNKKEELENRRAINQAVQRQEAELKGCDRELCAIEGELARLEQMGQKIREADANRKLLKSAENERDKALAAIAKKEKADGGLKTARRLMALKKEQDSRKQKRELSENLAEVSALEEQIAALEKAVAGLGAIQGDYKAADKLSRDIERIKEKLCSGKLRADIEMTAPHRVLLSQADGSTGEYQSGTVDVNGFIRLEIPNVGKITVSAGNVDVKKLQEEMAQKEKELRGILEKYSANTVELLAEKAEEYSQNSRNLGIAKAKRGGYAFSIEQLNEQIAQITIDEGAEIPDDLEFRINSFLKENKSPSLEAYKGICENTIEVFSQEYGTIEGARENVKDIQAKIAEYKAKAESEGLNISPEDFNRKVEKLRTQKTANHTKRDNIIQELGRLAEQADASADVSALEDECQRLEAELQNNLRLCRSYMRIREDLGRLLRENTGNKFEEFDKKFSEYIGIITNGRITARSAAENGLSLTSGDNTLDRTGLLSAGTRDSLLLAFRLAVLSFFFPNGGGVIVIDDLTEMDAARRENSARLLGEFAKNNQVILMTCDESIANLVGGNRIEI